MENIILEHLANSPEKFQELPVKDLAFIVLEYLKRRGTRNVNLYNLCVENGSVVQTATYGAARREFNDIKSPEFKARLGALYNQVTLPVAEAWSVLQRHGLLAHEPLNNGNFEFVTRRGLAIQSKADFDMAIGNGQVAAGAGGKKKHFGRAN